MSELWYYAKNDRPHGPVSREEIEALLRSGDLTPASLVWREGTPDWVPAQSVFKPSPSQAEQSAHPDDSSPPGAAPQAILNVEDCLREGWGAFRQHWKILVTGWILSGLIIPIVLTVPLTIADLVLTAALQDQAATASAALNLLSLLVSCIFSPPLQAGIFLLSLHALRQQPQLGTLFEPFRKCWVNLVLAALAVAIVTAIAVAIPVALGVPAFTDKNWVLLAVAASIAIALLIFLSLGWLFVLPLVADAGLRPLAALRGSMAMVLSQFFPCFTLAAVLLAINICGVLLCGLGLLITVPYTNTALMAAYRRLRLIGPPTQ